MAFSRKFLVDHGVPEDQVDAIMAERNRTLNDYIPKTDVETQIAAAVEAAQKDGIPPDVTQTEEYQKLAGKAARLEAYQTEDFKSVKTPYRDIVWDKLDHGDKHKAYAEQITDLATAMPDLFNSQEQPKPDKPQFGALPQGGMPTGEKGPSFMENWGFVPKLKGD